MRRFFAHMHLNPELPQVILIDDFALFFDQKQSHSNDKKKTLAMIADAVRYINHSVYD